MSPITAPSQIKMVRLMVTPVQVYSNDQTDFVDTYSFLDGGSNISLCTTNLMQRLKLRGAEVTTKIEGVTGSKHHQGFVVAMKLKGLQETELISLPSVLAVKELPNFKESIPTNKVVSKYNHLTGLNFPEMPQRKVEILIGADVWQAHVIHESIEGEPDQPRALTTGLGWTLFGPDPRTHAERHVVNCVQGTNEVLPEQMKRMSNYEFSDNSQTYDAPYSVEDKQLPRKAEISLTKVNGHYQQQLPSNEADVILPDNRLTVENRSALKVIVSCFESQRQKKGLVNLWVRSPRTSRLQATSCAFDWREILTSMCELRIATGS